MTTKEITDQSGPMAEFKKRVFERVQQDVGEFADDSIIGPLVEQAMQDAFFKPRVVEEGYHTKTLPPLFVEMVGKQAEPLVRKHARQYVEAHADEIRQAIDKFLDERGLMILSLEAIRSQSQNQMFEFAQEVVRLVKQGY